MAKRTQLIRVPAKSVILPRIATPAVNPPTGFDEVFMGTDGCLKSLKPDGTIRDYCPSAGAGGTFNPFHRVAWIVPTGITGSTPYLDGLFGDKADVSGTSPSVVNATSSEHRMIRFDTSFTAGNKAGVEGAANMFVGLNLNIYAYLRLPTITSIRFWFAITKQALASLLAVDAPGEGAGFRFSTPATDTNFRCFTTDSAPTSNNQDSGQAPSTATPKLFGMEYRTATGIFTFKIDSTVVATSSINLPGGPLRYVLGCETETGASRYVDNGWIFWEQWKD